MRRNELRRLELVPQRGGGRQRRPGEVRVDFVTRSIATNRSRHSRMSERELQRRGTQRHSVSRANRLEPPHALDDRRRRRLVEVTGALDRAGREDARVEWRCDDHGLFARCTKRQEIVERRVFEERVSAGEHEAIEIACPREARTHVGALDADADRADDAFTAQALERTIGAIHRFGEALFIGVAMPARVDIVDEHDVGAANAEPLQAVLQRAHRAVEAVIVVKVEWKLVLRAYAAVRPQHAADLGRQHELVARMPPQCRAEPVLAEAGRIERRRVEVAKSARVCVLEHVACPALATDAEQAATAESQAGQRHAAVEAATFGDHHARSPSRPVLRPLFCIRSYTSAAPRLSASATDVVPITHSLRRSERIEFIRGPSGTTAYILATLELSACALRKRYFGSRARAVWPMSPRTGTAPYRV